MSEFLSRIKYGSAIPWMILVMGLAATILVFLSIEYRSNSFSNQRLKLIGESYSTILGKSLREGSNPVGSDSAKHEKDIDLRVKYLLKNDTNLTRLVEKEAIGVIIYKDPNLTKGSMIARSSEWDSAKEYRSFVLPLLHSGELFVIRLADLNAELAAKYRYRGYFAIGVVSVISLLFFLLTYSYVRVTGERELKVNGMIKKMAETEERYKAILDAVPDPVLIVDAKTGLIEALNRQVVNHYGYSTEELLGKEYTTLSAEPDKSRAALRAMQRTIPKRLHRKKDGTVFSAEIKLGTVALEDGTKVVSVIRDIGERLKRDEAITATLRKEKDLRELREQQIANSSFTFRTPLSIVLSSIDILEYHSDKLSPQERDYHFGQMKSSIETLLQMLEEPTKNYSPADEEETGSE